MSGRIRRVSAGSGSVLDHWFAGLPDDKFRAFDGAVKDMESSYGMLSVSLNEAIKLRDQGSLIRAREQVAITADLVDRLAGRLQGPLGAIAEQGRQSQRLPGVAPLNLAFFRGKKARAVVLWQGLLERLMLSRRWRFRHKLRVLSEMVDELAAEFRHAAQEIADGATVHPGAHWEALDYAHYDLNTCLRETTIVLKSFLLALPDGQFEAFQRHLQNPAPVSPRRLRTPSFRVSA